MNQLSNSMRLSTALVLLLLAGAYCSKKNRESFSGAYKPAVKSYVKFSGAAPMPGSGFSGTLVKFKVAGLDSLVHLAPGDVQFLLNGIEAKIEQISPSDSTITIVVPDNASSGAATIVVKDRMYFGPQFKVKGDVWLDSTFNRLANDQQGNIVLGAGTNNTITRIYQEDIGTVQSIYIMGNFTQYNNLPSYDAPSATGVIPSRRSYVLKLNPADGAIKTDFAKGAGPSGIVMGLLPLTQYPGYLIYGDFALYNNRDGVNNMTRIYTNGMMDSVVQNVYNPNPLEPQYNVDTLPAFIGGFNDGVLKAFLDKNRRIISVGNFLNHRKNLYNLSTYTNVVRQITYMPNVGAMDQNGNLDTTYNYDRTRGQVLKGANEKITDAVQIRDGNSPYGKIIVVGGFTAFNNIPVQRIMMLDDNGQPDPSFKARANGAINRITYNPVTRKLLVMGIFTEFNGVATPTGIAMINEDGTTDFSFTIGELARTNSFGGNWISYAGQLNDGKIVIGGSFDKYKSPGTENFVTRQNFMILNADGTLAAGLNNTGAMSGTIFDILETKSGAKRALLLVGNFNLFDNETVGNIIRIGLEPK
ncbi:DUF5008 domain-containing protein [Niabella sp. CC-SYL272]|uniref:DUF5008 domain-containing protein n=1 Tax=Niabella agricola TaxID=2891571 RepID=UPI001F1F77AB|nr:DUF5008 domain-containing protein [Niabella agricola]MCF3108545.1 DUF5008 domain-containing protein [Niabella agricola]